MLTPQQIEQISFRKAAFKGYNIDSVDAILGPLTDDYIALYKENALLKSKMRVLVAKLEEYRQSEESLKEAVNTTQANCDAMVQETEAKNHNEQMPLQFEICQIVFQECFVGTDDAWKESVHRRQVGRGMGIQGCHEKQPENHHAGQVTTSGNQSEPAGFAERLLVQPTPVTDENHQYRINTG